MDVELPDDFRCPISLEIMTDPVILPSGHTFDRSSIQRWLDSGNLTCPVTNIPLPPSPPLIPNHALRSLISNFTPNNTPKNSHPALPPDPKTLVASLRFPADPDALSAVLRLSKRSSAFRRLLSDSGAVSVLLRHASGADARPDLQDLALRAVLLLSLDGDDARVGLVAEGAVGPVVAALRGRAAALAATTLTSLAVVPVNKCTIGAHPGAVDGLVALVRDGGGRERRESATALYELCKFGDNRRRTVRGGAVAPLVRMASGGSERAIEVLVLVGKCREGKDEMKRGGNFVIRVLAEVLRVGSPRGIEQALVVLNSVCCDCKEMASEAIGEGVLKLCVDLFDQKNERIAKNAAALARTLEKGAA